MKYIAPMDLAFSTAISAAPSSTSRDIPSPFTILTTTQGNSNNPPPNIATTAQGSNFVTANAVSVTQQSPTTNRDIAQY
ncbi:hypothetical protein DID88_009311 [Monilinia fructigena]|uniref:Uncharacterized protein n=1 Tax=Monilinia fructigena TaxID=38457 RepID=A0A395IFE8_9HELO|nr:hypothetical protein DID88_009311 [Monilinia fructigena]